MREVLLFDKVTLLYFMVLPKDFLIEEAKGLDARCCCPWVLMTILVLVDLVKPKRIQSLHLIIECGKSYKPNLIVEIRARRASISQSNSCGTLLGWLSCKLLYFTHSFETSTETNRSPSTPFRHYRQGFIYLPHSATTSFHKSLDSSSNPSLPCLVFP